MVKRIPMKHLTCFSLLYSSVVSATERPNIIYIFTDQQTANAMSCAGNYRRLHSILGLRCTGRRKDSKRCLGSSHHSLSLT